MLKNHLNKCSECFEKYRMKYLMKILNLTINTITINFYQITIDKRINESFRCDDGNIEILFSENNSTVHLEFKRLPDECKKQNFRIAAGTSIFRILSAEQNKIYFLNQPAILEDITEIKVSFLKIYEKEEKSSWYKSNNNIFYGAAAVILLAMYLIGYFYFTPVEKKVIANYKNKAHVDSSAHKEIGKEEESNNNYIQNIKENLIAENKLKEKNYTENSVLENFINRNVRSEENIKIIYPGINDTLKNNITLSWTSNTREASYHVIIVNNKNEKVWEKVTKGNELMVDIKLKNGLYYWKLYSNNKLNAVSKFYVKSN